MDHTRMFQNIEFQWNPLLVHNWNTTNARAQSSFLKFQWNPLLVHNWNFYPGYEDQEGAMFQWNPLLVHNWNFFVWKLYIEVVNVSVKSFASA